MADSTPSAIGHLQSAICNLQSAICNLLSAICLLAACSPPSRSSLTIYASLPLQGPSAYRALGILDGFRSRLAEAQNAACAGRYTLRLVSLDNTTDGEWDATLETAAANKAALDPAAIAFLASFDPMAVRVSLPNLASASSLLVVAPMNPSPGLIPQVVQPDRLERVYPAGPPAFLRLGPTSDEQGSAAAHWADRVGVRTAYVLFDRYDPAGQAEIAARGFRQTAHALGISVIGSFGVDRFASEYDSVMYRMLEETHRIGGQLPALVFYAGPPSDHLVRLFEAKTRWLGGADSTPLLSAPGFEAGEFLRQAGSAVDGALLLLPQTRSGTPSHVPGTEVGEESQNAVAEAAYGYDAAHLILSAIELACGNEAVDRRSVSRAALAIRSFSGRAGEWSSERGDGEFRLGPTPFGLYRVENGALTLLEAAPGER